MSKISKIKITNLFGISEFEADGKSLELLGGNGTGKTSILDAIRFNLTNRSSRDYIVRNGSTEGEIIIETDAGLSIVRKPRTNKTDYKSIKQDGKEVQSPEKYLNEEGIFTELQLDPIGFCQMNGKEQNKIMLDLVKFDWNLETIRGWFGEIPQGVDYGQHILQVLQQIADEKGYYFTQRQDINRDIRSKQSFIDEVLKSIPENYNAERWEKYDLGDVYTRIERANTHNGKIEAAIQLKENYNNKIRKFQADKEIEIAAIKNTIADEKNLLQSKIERLKAELQAATDTLSTLDAKESDKIKVAEANYEKNIAQFNEEFKTVTASINEAKIPVEPLREEAQTAKEMQAHLSEYRRMASMNAEIISLKEKSEDFTQKIEFARSLPATILNEAQLPLENMSIDGELVLINDKPVSNLSEGEKLQLCVDIALSNKTQLDLVLIDGVERLSSVNQKALYEKCKAAGVQVLATRTTNDEELTVIEL